MKYEYSGILKRKGGFFGLWNICYCEIKDNNFLIFKNQNQELPEKIININFETKIIPNLENNLRFSIEFQNGNIIFEAETEEIVMEWILAFKSIFINDKTTTMESFNIISVLGRGFYGKVMLCSRKNDGLYFAIKSVRKSLLIKTKKVSSVFNERNILIKIQFPFIVSLCFTFQSPTKFYFGLEFIPGGDLFKYIQIKKKLEIEEIRFYIAQIALTINYLHSKGIIYRDLKPENILLDHLGYIKLVDFGLSKEISPQNFTSTFCGTSDYLAPEIIKKENYNYSIDWWSLGILTYELFFLKSPFYNENISDLYENILTKNPIYPNDFSNDIIDFINSLLIKDPLKRFNFNLLKNHKFWNNLNFEKILKKEIQPLYIPIINNNLIYSNFDSNFTKEIPNDSLATPPGDQNIHFMNFSFENINLIKNDFLPPIPKK